jgi:methyl-accepting chemotaxis protein
MVASPVSPALPHPASNTLGLKNLALEADKKFKKLLVRRLCLAGIVLTSIGAVALIFSAIFGDGVDISVVIGTGLLSEVFVSCVVSYWLNFVNYYEWSSRILILSMLLAVIIAYISFGTATPLIVAFMLPVALSIVLGSRWETLVVTTGSALVIVGLYFAQNIFSFYTTPIFTLDAGGQVSIGIVLGALLLPAITALLLIPFNGQLRFLRLQNERLLAAVEEVEQVLTLSASLKTTAHQQAEGSHSQVTVITQVNTAVNELAQTARHITLQTHHVSEAAQTVSRASQQIEETVKHSVNQSEQGTSAVSSTVEVSREVAELYQRLLETLKELANRSKQIEQITEILEEIAGDTHLLAVNATIEATGAGPYGGRFRVIADEVRNLAEQASLSSGTVGQIVRDVANAVNASIDAVQSGYQKAYNLEETVQQAGVIISQMRQIAERSQTETLAITSQARRVAQLTATIEVAVSQQQQSIEEVATAVLGLGEIADLNASGGQLVLNTANSLEGASLQLNQALLSNFQLPAA